MFIQRASIPSTAKIPQYRRAISMETIMAAFAFALRLIMDCALVLEFFEPSDRFFVEL